MKQYEDAGQCEYCDEVFYHDAVIVNNHCYCSDDCYFEDEERRTLAKHEAKQQYDMYGLDFDSWYR